MGQATPPPRWPRDAGARVVRSSGAGGKGEAMAVALEATDGEVIVFLDADVQELRAPLRHRTSRPACSRTRTSHS